MVFVVLFNNSVERKLFNYKVYISLLKIVTFIVDGMKTVFIFLLQ